MMEKLFRVWNKVDKVMSDPFTLEDMYQAGANGLHRQQGEEDYEVMQYIDREDDNEEKLCESDIVKVMVITTFEDVEKIGIIEYMGGQDNAWGIDFPNAGVGIMLCDPLIISIEKIGTIYENPILYEGLCSEEEAK